MSVRSASGDRPPSFPPLHVLAWRGLVTGLGVGGVIGLLRLSHDHVAARLSLLLDGWRTSLWTIPLWFGVLVALAWGLRWIVRVNPLVGGSGIPQTELALKGRLVFCWWRVLLAKFAGSWLALFGGLAIGREGPSIQMGGAVGAGFDAVWRPLPEGEQRLFTGNPYVMAGAAAGLAAAFGAPLAGVLFAFEEMRSPRRLPLVVIACAAALGAHVMIFGVFGMGRILPFSSFRTPPLRAFWVVAVQGLIFGVLGVAYNHTLLWLHDAEARQRLIPDQWRALPPLVCAGLAAFLLPAVLGGGENLIILVAEKPVGMGMLVLLLVLKYLFAQYSTVASIPGGLLMPILCLGALWGRVWAEVGVSVLSSQGGLPVEAMQPWVLFGMVAYFAATVRAPLTGIALVTEMSGAYVCLPGNLLVGYVANAVANALRCPPIYDSLKERVRS